MTDRSDLNARRQALSDMMDGAADAGGVARACEAWRGDSGIRGDWYTYHLIGDVLRSEDLAHRPARDEAFLATLRTRLAAEPVVLAPAALREEPADLPGELPVVAPPPRRTRLWRRAWSAPAAVAAGFMAVAGVLVVTRTVEVMPSPQIAAAVPVPVPQGGSPAVVPVSVTSASGKLIRDARLDRYLAAHRQYGASSMLPVPAATAVSYGAVAGVTER